MIKISQHGSFKNTENFFKRSQKINIKNILEKYGKEGVSALTSATPLETGLTASSWDYEIHYKKGIYEIVWTNSNINDGIPIVILIQYGHSTKNGTFVKGKDFINPALKPVVNKLADEIWREVKSL